MAEPMGSRLCAAANRPLRVLMSHPDWSEPGGPTGHLPDLIEGLRLSTEIALHTFVYGHRAVRWLPAGIGRTVVGRGLLTLVDLIQFAAMLRRIGRPDLLHLNSAYECFALLRDLPYLVLARLLGIKTLVKTHGSNDSLRQSESLTWRVVQGLYWALVDRVTVLSDLEATQFQARFRTWSSKVVTAKNIVIQRDELRRPRECGMLLFAGRFVAKKNIPALLQAFGLVAHEHPHVRLAMAGTGPLEPELRRITERLGLQDRVDWLGWLDRDSLRDLYTQCEAVVFTSTGSEGMPMVLLEALTTNCAVLTTRVRFVESYPMLNLGVVCVNQPIASEIARGLRRILAGCVAAEDLASRRQRYLNQFSPDVVVEEFMALYRELVA